MSLDGRLERSPIEANGSEAAADGERRPSRVGRWLDRLNSSKRVMWVLFSASFAETIIVPIPIELVLVPFMVTNRHRLWRIAAMVTAGCLVASIIGYGIGYLFFDTVGRWALEAFGWEGAMDEFRRLFDAHGFVAIMAVGIIPIPFQVAMLAAGAAGYPIPFFVLAATIARGIRYFGLALLVRLLGDRAETAIRRHRKTSMAVLTVAFVIFFAVVLLK